MIDKKRGIVLIVLVLLSLIFSASMFSAQDEVDPNGCYMYSGAPEGVYCQEMSRSTAEADCEADQDCDLGEFNDYFFLRQECSAFPECEEIICNDECVERTLGKCQQLGGQEVLDSEYDLWCTPGCCKIPSLSGSIEEDAYCGMLLQFQCEEQARNLIGGTPDVFDNVNMDLVSCNELYCGVEVEKSSIKGTIKDSDDQSLGGVTVILEGTEKTTTTNSNGEYSFNQLSPGNYFVKASKEGYDSKSNSFSISAGEEKVVNFTLTTSVGVAKVYGKVLDNENQPLQAKIFWTGRTTGESNTNDDGSYQTELLPEGEYTFTASKIGYQPQQTPVIIIANDVPLDFKLGTSVFEGVTGTTFIEERGEQVSVYGAKIYINGRPYAISSYPDGKYEIKDLSPSEEYEISATYLNYEMSPQQFTILAGEKLEKDLLLKLFVGECTELNTEKDVENLFAEPLTGEKAIKLTWDLPCSEVLSYGVRKVDQYGNEEKFTLSPTIVEYIDEDVQWGNDYTYHFIAYYDLNRISNEVASNTINVGNQLCEDHYLTQQQKWETFCILGTKENRKTVWTCNDLNQLEGSLGCAGLDGDGKNYFCAETTEGTAVCKDSGSCGLESQPFGLYQDLEQCYGNSNPFQASNYCYFEYTDTIIDQCKSCEEVKSCFDYNSEDACAINNCLGSECQWVNGAANQEQVIDYGLINLPLFVTPETGAGYCTETSYEQSDYCQLCSPGSDLFENNYCTAEVCSSLGACFSNPVHQGRPLSSCYFCDESPSRDANCYSYSTELECTGENAISINPYGQIEDSSDQCGWGKCLWLGESNGYSASCVKDADADGLGDCDDFTSGERTSCEIDVSAPRTKIVTDNIAVISHANPEIVFEGNDNFHEKSSQKNKLGVVGYCLTPLDRDDCVITNGVDPFVEMSYDGSKAEELVSINLINSQFLTNTAVNGKSYKIKYYSEDKFHNREEVQESYVYVDNVVPDFIIESENNSIGDKTNLDVYLVYTSDQYEPMKCTFELEQVIPLGDKQTKIVLEDQREKEVFFNNLNGISYDLNVTCEDKQGNINSKMDSVTFDLEPRIDFIYPEMNGAVAERSIEFRIHTDVGVRCTLYKSADNSKVADFEIIDEEGKEHKTAPVSGFTHGSYSGVYKVVCNELLISSGSTEAIEDYFDFVVDFTGPDVQIVLQEDQNDPRYPQASWDWKEFFVRGALVSFDYSNDDGFDYDKTFYCLGEENSDLCQSNTEYTAPFMVNESSRICYYSTDVAGRNSVPICGDIIVNGYGITLESPKQYIFNNEQWGISNTPVFDWKFSTVLSSNECRFDYVPGFSYDTLPLFKILTPNANNKYLFNEFPELSGSSDYPESGGEKAIYLKCKNSEDLVSPEERIWLEYDPTEPEIVDAYADPNPLLEGNSINLFVETDDKTLCKYSVGESGAENYDLMRYAFSGGEADVPGADNSFRILNYQHQQEYVINNFVGLKSNYTFNIQCKNGAEQLSELEKLTTFIDYTQKGGISSIYPDEDYLPYTSVDLSVITTKNAFCTYRNSDGEDVLLSGSGGREHSYSFSNLDEKEYTIPIKCTLGDHSVEVSSVFTIDLTAPQISNVNDNTYSCGSDQITVSVRTNEEKLSKFYYEVYQLNQVDLSDGYEDSSSDEDDDNSYTSSSSSYKSYYERYYRDLNTNSSESSSTTDASSGNNSEVTSRRNTLSTQGKLLFNNTVNADDSLEIDIDDLNESYKYKVRVSVQDAAGHWSDFKESDGFIITSSNYSSCINDDSAPKVNIIIDDESSCTTTYVELDVEDETGYRDLEYGKSVSSSSCNANSSYNNKLLFKESGWVCYDVSDVLNHSQNGKKQILFLDDDGDGIKDSCDLCDSTPAGKIVGENGCADGQVPPDEEKEDQDGDGLPDYWESFYDQEGCELNFVSIDSNDNGIIDRDEDYDEDGYSNYEEYQAGYNPCLSDAPDTSRDDDSDFTPGDITSEEGGNTLAWILFILGLLLVLSGTGYLIYYYKYSENSNTITRNIDRSNLSSSIKTEKQSVTPGIKSKFEQLRQGYQKKTKSRRRSRLFSAFDKNSNEIPHVKEMLSKKSPQLNKVHELAHRYVADKEKIAPGLKKSEKSLFNKLESIAKKTKSKDIKDVINKDQAKDIFSKLKKLSKERGK
jgi:hypothetical protein